MPGQTNNMKVGIIGCGHWGPNVLRNFARHRRVKVKSVCDINEAALARAADYISEDCVQEADPLKVIGSQDLNAVVITTPASTHYELVKAALRAGKHVFCEKPLCLTSQEGGELCHLADDRGLKLLVSHTFLFNQGVIKLKSLIDDGLLGQVYYLTSSRTHMGLVRNDVNVMWDLVPHDIAIMCFLLGATPIKVSAVGACPLGSASEDVAFVTLFFPGGIIGHINASWLDPQKVRLLTVSGSRAKAVFNDLDNIEPVKLFEKGIGTLPAEADYGQFRFLVRDGDIISPKIDMKEPLAVMVDAFVRLVLDNEPTISDGRFALMVTKVLEAAQRSLSDQGAPQPVQ